MPEEHMKEFEFIANRMRYDLSKQDGVYTDTDTRRAAHIWRMARSDEPLKLMREWERRKVNSKDYKGKLNVILAVVDDVLTKVLSNQQIDEALGNDVSYNTSSKQIYRKKIIEGLFDIGTLVGEEYLICGVMETNHKRVCKKIRDLLKKIGRTSTHGYTNESLLQTVVHDAVLVEDEFGIRLNDYVVGLLSRAVVEDAKYIQNATVKA